MSPIRRSQRVLERSLLTGTSSNTNPPAQALAETTLTVLPHFPNEIILTIVGHLAFDDLKSARLLSKAWSSCASPLLFLNLSVSPNKEDLEVFEAITQHPQLSKFVRHLWYDGSEFLLHLSKTLYLERLHRQTRELHVERLDQTSANKLHGSELEMSSWVEDAACNQMFSTEILAMYRSAEFVNDGYRKYHEHAIYQQKCLQDGTFVKSLVQGLKQLDNVKVVTLDCSWDADGPGKGSHLARSWSILDCRPASWEWGRRNKWDLSVGDGAEHYRILVSALVQAQRRIRAFQTRSGSKCAVAPSVFDTSLKTRKAKPLQFRADNTIAFSEVEELGLRLASYGNFHYPQLYDTDNIANLPALLGSMGNLKLLELRLPALNRSYRYYTYDQVFPRNMRWENLKALKLFKIYIGATDLILLFLNAFPRLEHLEMGKIDLSQGCWEGVFEALKQMNRLRVLRLPNEGRLCHHGRRDLTRADGTRQRLYHQLTIYVLNGERHPCLPLEEPNSAARDYTRDLDPALRQRLLTLDSANHQTEYTA